MSEQICRVFAVTENNVHFTLFEKGRTHESGPIKAKLRFAS